MNYDIIFQKLNNGDEIYRDQDGNLVLEHKLKTIIENLAIDKDLSADQFDDYISYDYSINKKFYTKKMTTYKNTKKNEAYVDPIQISSMIIDFNEMNKNAPTYIPDQEITIEFSKLPTASEKQYRYISSVFDKESIMNWQKGDRVFLSAGTGKGKNTFIREMLLKYCRHSKIVIFENRSSLLSQQIKDLVGAFNPDLLKYCDIVKDNMVVFGPSKNFMIVSYQKATLNILLGDSQFNDFCQQADYLIFDEIHYILDDAKFNKGIEFFVRHFLLGDSNVKLFLSGSMEESFLFLQEICPFENGYRNMIDEPLEQICFFNMRIPSVNRRPNHVLHMPTNYAYINPYMYQGFEDIINKIYNTDSKEKWLIFVDSKKAGTDLLMELLMSSGLTKEDVKFIDADNKNSRENSDVYNCLINNEMFECRILIATTVIYNGVNIKDDALKHIVLPFTTVPITKQLIGRKRVKEEERVSVYFPIVPETKVIKHLSRCLQDYYEINNFSFNIYSQCITQLNGLGQTNMNDYVCFSSYMNENKQCVFIPCMNNPAIKKLHFDTIYYLFLLQKLRSGKNYAHIMLRHLELPDDISIEDIKMLSEDEIKEQLKKEVSEYLDKYKMNSIEENADENCEYKQIGEFCAKMNDFSMRLNNKAISTHWKDQNRFISKSEFDAFLQQLDLTYIIEIKKARGQDSRTLSVIEKNC